MTNSIFVEDGNVQWPGFSTRQQRVARDTVRLATVSGQRVFSMPLRINAGWWWPLNPTRDELRWIYGRVADLHRW